MHELRKKLKLAQKAANRANCRVQTLEDLILNSSDLDTGDAVRIIKDASAAHLAPRISTPPAIGTIAAICNVQVNHSGQLLYTLTWRDDLGVLWCFTRDEIERV